MPGVRKPNAEQQVQDRQIVTGAAFTLRAVAARHGSERLALAAELADAFVAAPAPAAKPRVRKAKAQALSPEQTALAHHSV